MKSVLRTLVIFLTFICLLTGCGKEKEIMPQTNESTSDSEKITVSETTTTTTQANTKKSEVQQDIIKSETGTYEYKILGVHAGNQPVTNLHGGIHPGIYENYISFCYLNEEGNVVFETVITDKYKCYNYEVYCNVGDENKVIITTDKQKNKSYNITLTEDTYLNIYGG